MGEIGVLTPSHRVELLEGWIVEKMNHRPDDTFVVRLLDHWFQSNIPPGWLVQCQLPITLLRSEPEPDLAIVRGAHADYRDRHPGGSDCRLVIEVADTSLAKDRVKSSIYASAEIEEYWIVNLETQKVERMTHPNASNYDRSEIFQPGQTLELRIGEQLFQLDPAKLFEGLDKS